MLGPLLLSLAAAAIVPTGQDLPVGPPAPHLDHDLARQWQLSARPDWRSFRDRWGGAMRWDQRDASPHFWYGSGVPLEQADDLVADLAALAGVDPGQLELAQQVVHDGQPVRRLLRWDRSWRGVDVVGDQILLVVIDGRIGGAWVRLSAVRLDAQPRPGEVVFPVPQGPGRPALATLVRAEDEGSQRVFVDRLGDERHRYQTRRHATGQVSFQQRTVGDELVTAAARQVTVADSDGLEGSTDDDGWHDLEGPVEVLLDGDVLGVTVTGAEVRLDGLDADFSLTGGEDIPQSAATVQHHFHVVWDWLGQRWPSHRWLDERVPADVEVRGSCNAYYTSGTINFYRDRPGSCNNLGEIADVVYHEVGHGIHDYILAGGTFAGDVSEGSSDYISATILDDPILAPGAWGEGSYIREIETDKIYPDDVLGEVHADGLIWASFLWNLRAQWQEEHFEDEGAELTDKLFLGALEQGPSLTDVYEAVLLADDDDGDLGNGTPNACELVELLDQHGLGPGAIGVVVLEHQALGPQASETAGYELALDLFDLTIDCSGVDLDSVTVWYTIDDDLAPPTLTEMEPLDGFIGWDSLLLEASGSTWTASIPRQPANARVRYFFSMASSDGSQLVASHGGDPDQVDAFWVGDREALWCEGFEEGAEDWTHGTGLLPGGEPLPDLLDEWEVGSPTGEGAWDPDLPYAGDAIVGTDLAGDYDPNNQSYLQSPRVELGETGLMLLLSYQRWLTVEDSLYDLAELLIGGDPAWVNAGTADGGEHHLDLDWTLHELPLEGRVDEEGGVELTWTLSTDQGLEYGGWHLDDVCVVQLDDAPAHYRRVGLQASDDTADVVTLSWTDPWIQPLQATILVAKRDDWPDDIDDGRIVAVDFAATWGAEHVVEDSWVLPGESWHYALFAAGADAEDWYVDVVEGENGAIGGISAMEPEDTGDTGLGGTDGGTDGGTADGGTADGGTADGGLAGEGGESGGGKAGGCSTAPVGSGSLLLVGLVGLARRRRDGRTEGRTLLVAAARLRPR